MKVPDGAPLIDSASLPSSSSPPSAASSGTKLADPDGVRRRVLVATTALFAEHGDEVGLAEIVVRARVSRRAFYRHFRDLNELRIMIHEQAVRTTVDALRTLPDRKAVRGLEWLLDTVFGAIAANASRVRMVLRAVRRSEPSNVAFRERVYDSAGRILVDALASEHGGASAPTPPGALTLRAMVAAIEGLAVHFLEGDAERARDAVPAAVRIVRALHPR
jgi:AcrR family transcriptional regulator